MPFAHVSQSGNISIPKIWRDELGIEPNSEVLIEKENDKIIIEPLKIKSLKEALQKVDEEARRQKIFFTIKEAVKDDLYDQIR